MPKKVKGTKQMKIIDFGDNIDEISKQITELGGVKISER